jgi:hypothetical protein
MSSTYGWIITRDYLDEEDPVDYLPSRVGTEGPRDFDWVDPVWGDATEFRMYDDDGVLYFEGMLLLDDNRTDVWNEAEEEEAFGPLYDFGQPDSGCTEIRYKLNNQWKTI